MIWNVKQVLVEWTFEHTHYLSLSIDKNLSELKSACIKFITIR